MKYTDTYIKDIITDRFLDIDGCHFDWSSKEFKTVFKFKLTVPGDPGDDNLVDCLDFIVSYFGFKKVDFEYTGGMKVGRNYTQRRIQVKLTK
jgi:hypothetical protein